MVKWTTLIISIFLTIFGRSSDIKLDMLEAIEGVANHAKTYSWANYLADLVKINYEKCQEQGTPIRFCSLLIWIAMSKISPIDRLEFTTLSSPSMYNYACFKIRAKNLAIPNPKHIFTMWLQEVKSACHKWRVPQNIHWALPPTFHIELGLDHTKLWYVDDQATEPTELSSYPTVNEMFGELTR